MASINWGPYQNRVRLGLLVWQTPAALNPTTKQVAVDIELYMQVDGMLDLTGNANVIFTGAWTGEASIPVSIRPGQRVRLWKTTAYVATAAAARNLVYAATVSHPNGPTYHSVTHRLAARPDIPPPKPEAPSAPTVTRVSDTRHTLNWNKSTLWASAVIQRSDTFTGWQTIARPKGNLTTWTDTTTKPGRSYLYRVAGVNASGQSPWSGQSAVVRTTPEAPWSVTAKRSGGSIIVDAMTGNGPRDTFDVEDNGTVIATGVSLSLFPWTHSSPAAGSHRYRIRLRTTSGGTSSVALTGPWSSYSNTVQVIAPPNAPTKLSPNGTATPVGTTARFAWAHNPTDSSDQTQYQIRWRAVGATTWTERTAVTSANQFADLALSIFGGVGVFEWAVRTRGSHATFGPYSATATVDVVSVPEVGIGSPEDIYASAIVWVDWTFFQAEARGQTAWEAQLLDQDGATLETKSGTGGFNVMSFAWRVEPDKSYTVRLRAASGSVWSAWSEKTFTVVFVAPLPPLLFGEWDEDSGSVTISTGRGANDPAPDVTNLFTNPSLVTVSGSRVEVRRNLIFDPHCVDTTLRFAAFVPEQSTVQKSTEAAYQGETSLKCVGTAPSVMPVSGNGYESRADVAVSATAWVRYDQVGQQVHMYLDEYTSSGAYVRSVFAGRVNVTDPTVWRQLLGAPVAPTTSGNHMRPRVQALGSGTLFVDEWCMEVGLTGVAFSGATPSPDADLQSAWTGSANQSPSILTGAAVAGVSGVNCAAIASSRFGGSVRLIPTSESNDSYAQVAVPAAARVAGTALATVHLERALTGTLAARSRCLALDSPAAVGEQPANAEGSTLQRVPYAALTSGYTARLYHGGSHGSGDVYWTQLGLFNGSYAGEWFDGDMPMINTGTGWKRGGWDGTPHASTSTAKTIAVIVEKVDVFRSVDGGLNWETLVIGADPDSNFVDWESLSNGDTMYRAIAYAETTGASSITDITVRASSGAVWLSGGFDYALAARLPFDAKVKVAASRERSLQRYEGRSLGVPYAGEHVQRTIDASGRLIENDEENATVDDLVRIAQSESPLHMHRDPDGRRVYGMLSEISLPRDDGTAEGGIWQWSYQLQESDH